MIQAFRGEGKSWISSGYSLWRLYNDPDYKVLVISATGSRSIEFSTFTRRLINEVPFLKHLKAHPNQRDSILSFDVGPAKPSQAPSVKACGIFGQITGSRATEIIADDIEIPNNSATEDAREKLVKACMEFEAIIMPDIGQITYLGTPQSEESVYNKLREKNYVCRIWPARYPSLDNLSKYAGALAPSIEQTLSKHPEMIGKPTDPKRFNDLDLLEREGSYGKSGFTLQFMLDTSLSDAERYPLKTSDIIVMSTNIDKAPISISWCSSHDKVLKELRNIGFTGDRWYGPMFIDKDWAEYEGSIMAVDPSGRGSDETAYAVVKQLHGNLFATAAGGLKGGYDDDTLTKLALVAKEQKINGVIVEANFGDGMFSKIFQPILNRHHPCVIEEIKNHTQKEKRIIDILEPVLNRHRLIVDVDVIKKDLKKSDENPVYSLFYQLTRITKDRGSLKHDDILDVLAMAVGYWVESMSRDESKAAINYKNKLLDKELQDFMKHALSINTVNVHKNTRLNWVI
jgi:hypothetical protein